MLVTLETTRVGQGYVNHIGDEIEVSDEEGMALIAAGSATAVQRRPETAALKHNRDKTTAIRGGGRN